MGVHSFPGGRPKTDDMGGEPPDNSDMLARLAKLEAAVPNLATREDLAKLETAVHKAINEQTWKLIGWTTGLGAALVAVAFYIARNVK